MKPRLVTSAVLFFFCFLLSAQVPQGFNYQAIARNSTGKEIINTSLQVKISILSDTSGFYLNGTGTYIWEELQNVTTNSFGLFTLVVGSPTATKTLGTAASFSAINWNSGPLYIGTKVNYLGSWKNEGTTKLGTVPYSMVSGTLSGPFNKLAVKGSVVSPDSALFEVKNNNGQTVFAVYNEGIRAYVDNGIVKSATKGGFAIGGFETAKGVSQNLMMISPDSARIYVDETKAKGATKGGFAIGGFNTAKGTTNKFLLLTPKNYFIGHYSGLNIDTAAKYNATIGYETAKYLTKGTNNIFVGYQSGLYTTTGSDNVFVGTQAGYGYGPYYLSGDYNIAIGRRAGFQIQDGFSNILIGDLAGRCDSTGYQNVIIGDYAGYNNSSGYRNIFLGAEAGWSNKNGNNNIFMGFEAGVNNITGHQNIAIGNLAGAYNTNGVNNILIGDSAGYSNSSGYQNIFLGVEAGRSNSTGNNNIFLGYNAGYKNTIGHDNIAIGNLAGVNIVDGVYNVMVGTKSGNKNISGYYNSFVGYQSGENSTGNWNTMFGYLAGNKNSSAGSQVLLGYQAGMYNTGGWNTMIGSLAGDSCLAGYENTFVGLASGQYCSGNRNVFLGRWAGRYEPQSNNYKLVIESNYNGSDNYNNALIYGDFLSKYLRINGTLTATSTVLIDDSPAIIGQHNTSAYFGYGVKGYGGYMGIRGEATLSGTGSRYGLYGTASGGTLNYGIYATATGGTAYAGYFNGNVYATGTITQLSDKKYKKNIAPISGSLSKVLDLQGVTYEWKTETELSSLNLAKSGGGKESETQPVNLPKGTQVGVIAQDVELVIPELVQTDGNGIKSVDYIKIIPFLIEGMKEQQKTIESQSKRIDDLEKTVNLLIGQKK